MNAAKARKQRGGETLLERVKRDPERARHIDQLVAAASVEQFIQAIMDSEQVSAAELARRVRAKPPQISRDLHGGFSKATIKRLAAIARALDYDFVPVFVPRFNEPMREQFLETYRALIPVGCVRTEDSAPKQKKRASSEKQTVAKGA